MATLYQKYRPKNFAEVVNQNHIKITVQNELETNDISHAYLFSGPRGTGKTTMARVLAKAVNCSQRKQGEHEPCGACDSCRQIDLGSSLDIIEIDAASHTGVANVRENIIASARVAISSNRYKIFIIDEVHMLSVKAFNALLKTLEEPPQKVIFILATTEVHKLPTTIISRCQRFDFKRISVTDIVKKLTYIALKEGVKVDQAILENIARQSDGHMRDAESLFGQIISISGKTVTMEKAELVIPQSQLLSVITFIDALSNKDAAGAISLTNQLVDEGIDLKNFTSDIIETLRKMMLLTISPQLASKFTTDLGANLEEKIQPLAEKIGTEQLVRYINELLKAKEGLKNAFVIQLPLEIAAVILCTNMNDTANTTATQLKKTVTSVVNKSYDTVKQAGQAIPYSLSIGYETIKSGWNEVLLLIKKNNHSLSFIMRVCDPRVINKQLCLVFKYKFHKDRLEQPQIRSLVDQTLKQVYKVPISFITDVDESLEVEHIATELNTDAPAKEVLLEAKKAKSKKIAGEKKTEPAPAEQPVKEVSRPNETDASVEKVLEMFGGRVVS